MSVMTVDEIPTAISQHALVLDFFCDAHRLEQYLTFSQSRSHFLRQVKGLLHTTHVLVGNSDFFIVL